MKANECVPYENEFAPYERWWMARQLSQVIKEAFKDPKVEEDYQRWLKQKKECTSAAASQCTQ